MVEPQFKIFEFLTVKNALQKETSALYRPLIFYDKKREKGRKKRNKSWKRVGNPMKIYCIRT